MRTVDCLPEQIEFIANIVRLWRGSKLELSEGGAELLKKYGLGKGYVNVDGLCSVATTREIVKNGWSLKNPGRYVGTTAAEFADGEDFQQKMQILQEEVPVVDGESGGIGKQNRPELQGEPCLSENLHVSSKALGEYVSLKVGKYAI